MATVRSYLESIGQAVVDLQDRSDDELEKIRDDLTSADATLWQAVEDLSDED